MQILIYFLLGLAGVFPLQIQADDNSVQTVTFIHMNDLHAHLTPHLDEVRVVQQGKPGIRIEEKGGLARTATLIKRIRKDNPASVLMNIGDTYHGGVEALFTNGNAIVDPVNALGIDVGVPGNWDFAYGPQITRARYLSEAAKLAIVRESETGLWSRFRRWVRGKLEGGGRGARSVANMMMVGTGKPNFPNLAANVTLYRSGETFLPATLMRDIAGVKIGFIGITSDIVPKMHKMLAVGLDFLQGETAYRDLINQLAGSLREQGADLVVVMSELGIQKDHRLAQVVDPGVDVFFSAHTHETTFKPLHSDSGALVVEAGNDGFIGRMDISLRAGEPIDFNWELIPVDQRIPDDPEVAALVRQARAPFLAADIDMQVGTPFARQYLQQPIDSVVGHLEHSLSRYAALESSFNNAFTDILRQYSQSDVAISPGFRFAVMLPGKGVYEDRAVMQGEVRLEDVYRYFPVIYGLSKGNVTGKSLRNNIELLLTEVFSPDVFKQAGGWVSGLSGLSAKLDLSRQDGQRILELRRSDTGRLISDDEILTVAGCSRPLEDDENLCSQPGFSDVKTWKNKSTGKVWTPVDLFVAALADKKVNDGKRHDLVDQNQTAEWPQSEFIQPLEGIN